MQNTLGPNNIQAVQDDNQPSLMTLIPIKVSNTTLRETPHGASPSVVMTKNDKTNDKYLLNHGNISADRCKFLF
jgi:hypothetical protein